MVRDSTRHGTRHNDRTGLGVTFCASHGMRALIASAMREVRAGDDRSRVAALASLLALFVGLISVVGAAVAAVVAFAVILGPMIGFLGVGFG